LEVREVLYERGGLVGSYLAVGEGLTIERFDVGHVDEV
jgi:hypothetical protein